MYFTSFYDPKHFRSRPVEGLTVEPWRCQGSNHNLSVCTPNPEQNSTGISGNFFDKISTSPEFLTFINQFPLSLRGAEFPSFAKTTATKRTTLNQ